MAWVAALMVVSTSCHGWWSSGARWRRRARRISGNGLTSSLPAWVRAAGPVQSRWRRQMVRCGGRRQATGPVMRRRAVQRRQAGLSSLTEPAGVAQVKAGVVPVEPRDPGQRLARRGREAFLPVLLAAAGVQDDRGGVVQGAGEFGEFQVVGVGEPSGGPDYSSGSSSQLPGLPPRREESSWSAAAAQRRGRTSLAPASGGRSSRGGEGGCLRLAYEGSRACSRCVADGVVSQAPIRRSR